MAGQVWQNNRLQENKGVTINKGGLSACLLIRRYRVEEREYEITIREVLERTVVKKAISEETALETVKADYASEKIILDAHDFAYHEFTSRVLPRVRDRGR